MRSSRRRALFPPRRWTPQGRSGESRRGTERLLRNSAPVLQVLGVPASTYYGWLAQQRDPSPRRGADAELLDEIRRIHARSGATYGAPRVHATLRRRGHDVAGKRVERLMRENGAAGRAPAVARPLLAGRSGCRPADGWL
ncbi:IS3 family transposase [Pseudonocardia xinjiangensis]|uniref:IS3 family transposase n=1 Tax=Pseudonocardia xinjiangensis TaxID=75289 RepID=A0ABX1RLH9_9PSEU|nr:IS3 family transposase [Pseudonocardia xinjiangensis]